MVPFLYAEEHRDALLQIGNQFASRSFRIIPAKERQIAVESPGGFRKLEFIGSRPPPSAGKFGDFVLVCEDAKHDEAVLQGEWPALPEVWLRVESHRRCILTLSVEKPTETLMKGQ
jgi:hypothetical protein